MREFDLIARYFSKKVPEGYLGAGDDGALLPLLPGRQWAVSTDALIEGRHFLPEVDPFSLGYKSLAVNLSDLAAMGATPAGCVLALALPDVNELWLSKFSDGFHQLAEQSRCPLVGGDTTGTSHGIMVCVTVFGHVTPGTALLRSAAQSGDDVWVTGSLGAAHIALKLLQGSLPRDDSLLTRTRPMLEQPRPPTLFAAQLPGLAHAALDISDGFLQDLGHIVRASKCGARIIFDYLPIDPVIEGLPNDLVEEAVLSGGDVYQLC
ncbi:MAG: thiamine-phosphate kinase, partial [Pusillimonas sp.]|nr:thiamine-phosphate kinase [Pusillimonas sp.]